MRRHKRTGAAVLALVAFVGTACVKQKPPGVAIRNLKADIVFGLAPPAAAPPSVVPPVDIFDIGGGLPPIEGKLPLLPPPPPAPFCRTAQISDAPEKQAGLTIHDQPTVGRYRWKLGGKISYNGVELPIVGQYFNRDVIDVTKVEESTLPAGGDPPTEAIHTKTFSYTMRTSLSVIGAQAPGVQEARYQVKDEPIAVSLNNGVPVAGGGLGKSVVVGDPERGITLKSLVSKDATGKVTSQLSFTPGLLLLPLKVNPGERYQSVAVDSASGAVIIHDGLVEKRDFVDACGDLIQGWKVNSRQTYIYGVGSPVVAQYDYMFAPQYGGLLIYEKIGPPDLNNFPLPVALPPVGSPTPNIPSPPTTLPALPIKLPGLGTVYEYTVGQLHPSDLP
jgi:hypothetical protein